YNFAKKYHPKMNKNYKPKVAVIYPCKGNSKHLIDSLKGVVNQDYEGVYEIVFVVESTDDPAYQVIKDFIKPYNHTKLIVAGHSHKCIQKNHNVIKAIQSLPNDVEVYTFIDAHNTPAKNWLRVLINTLSIPGVEISTVYRVAYPKPGKLGSQIYSGLITAMYYSNVILNIVWGGSFSIRKETLAKYDYINKWANGMSHDSPINSSNVNALCNPAHIISDEHIDNPTLKELAHWFKRQWSHFRIYNPVKWTLALLFTIGQLLIVVSIPIFLIYTLFNPMNLINYYLIFSTIVVIGMLITWGIALSENIKGANPIKYSLFAFILFLVFFYGLVAPLFKREIVWSGKRYKLDKEGNLESIQEEIEKIKVPGKN
ncbi:MAG: glycosyltransferase, partial [Spirochaetota bacterium]